MPVVHDPAAAARWSAAVNAASNILWLAAAAIGAVLFGIATMLVRGYVVADLEKLERVLTRDSDVQGDDEVARLRARFQQLQEQVGRLGGSEAAGLMAVAGYRDAAAGVADQLAVADRLGLTGQVALGVAHEVGGQLAVAQVALDILPTLTRDEDEADRNETVADLQHALEGIGKILTDLNALGLGTQTPQGERAELHSDVAAVVQRVLRLSKIHQKVRHVELTIATDNAHLSALAALESGRLEQVLLNLVINAADAMNGRGNAELSWFVNADQVVIEVADSGPGIAPSERERVFEAFVTTKPADSGSGLGLSVSRRLVEAVGGQLEVADSGLLGGAVMRVTLPTSEP